MTKKIFLWGFQGEVLGVLKVLEAIKAMKDSKTAKTRKPMKIAEAAALFMKKIAVVAPFIFLKHALF